jgi:nicotinate-nucleotide adenylyltransferase
VVPASPRIGILGGTFDPVHVAHLVVAVEARYALALDRLLLVVAPQPWQKHGSVIAPATARHAMVEAAVADIPGLEASRIELEREGPTYTIDTVETLRAQQPDADVALVVGSDVAASIATWHRADELCALVTLAIVARDGESPTAPAGWQAQTVSMPRLDVSSTDIRERVASGRPIDGLVPASVVRVIRERGLYTRS